MENMKTIKASLIALIISIFPAATLIPVFLKITLPDVVRYVWVGINMGCILVGFVLSIVCTKSEKANHHVGKVALGISVFWLILVIGILLIALISNLPQ